MTESDRIEVERRLASVEHEISHLRAIFQRQTMQQIGTASPRVVAGPLRLVEETRILTHPTCAIPCASCDDDGRPDLVVTTGSGCALCDVDAGPHAPCTRRPDGEAA